jgi:hypothetical protein
MAQPATRAMVASSGGRSRFIMLSGMLAEDKTTWKSGLWIVVLEAAVALALLVFIVWWTVPKKRRKDESEKR